MTDEQLLEYRRVKLLERDKQISKLVEEISMLREGLRESYHKGYEAGRRAVNEAVDTQPEVAEDDYNTGFKAGTYKANMVELRDHFAGLAMQGLVGKHGSRDTYYEEDAEHYYFIADAMLAERGKNEIICL